MKEGFDSMIMWYKDLRYFYYMILINFLLFPFSCRFPFPIIAIHMHPHLFRELFQAISDNDKDELLALVHLKANVNCRDEEGYTPLHRAADRNFSEVRKVGKDSVRVSWQIDGSRQMDR